MDGAVNESRPAAERSLAHLIVMHPDVVSGSAIGSFNLHPRPAAAVRGPQRPKLRTLPTGRTARGDRPLDGGGVDTGAIAYEVWFTLSDADTGLSVSVLRPRGRLMERLLRSTRGSLRDPERAPADPSQRHYYRQAAARCRTRGDHAGAASPPDRPGTRQRLLSVPVAVGLADGATRARSCAVLPPPSATQRRRPGNGQHANESGVPAAAEDEWVLVERVQADGGPQPRGRGPEAGGIRLADGQGYACGAAVRMPGQPVSV